MLRFKFIVCAGIFLNLFSMGLYAQQAGQEGHGGGGFECPTDLPTDPFVGEAVQLLDLWEAEREPLNYTVNYSNEPSDVQIARALRKLALVDAYFARRVATAIRYVQNHQEPIRPDEEIPFPDDAKNKVKKKGCGPVGLALYDDELKKLRVDSALVDSKEATFDKTNYAALFVHEGVYKVMREEAGTTSSFGDVHDSTGSRRLTACLFAKEDCLKTEPILLGLPTNRDIFQCSSPSTEFYIFKIGGYGPYDSVRMQFSRLLTPLKTRTIADFSAISQGGGYDSLVKNTEPTNTDGLGVKTKSILSKYQWGLNVEFGSLYHFDSSGHELHPPPGFYIRVFGGDGSALNLTEKVSCKKIQ